LFDDRGEPRLADFGCVRDLSARRLTQSGTVLGTPAYMAPEQLAGRPVDGQADVFALGVILHELVAGERPYPATTLVELHRQVRTGRRAPLAPPGLEAIVASALDPLPERRCASARELARALEALLAAPAAPENAPRGSRLPLVAGALALGLGGVALAFALASGDGEAGLAVAPGASPSPRRSSPAPNAARSAGANANDVARHEAVLASRVRQDIDERKADLAAQ